VRGGKGWFRQKNKNKNVWSSRRKFAFGRRSKNVKRPRAVKQIERGRGRELAGLRKRAGCYEEGEIPPLYPVDVEYSTPSATVSIKNYVFISSFSNESGCILKNLI
jgi:hypothetical protein